MLVPSPKERKSLLQLHMLHLNSVHHSRNVGEINENFVYQVDFINIAMLMHYLIEYSDNYSDTSGCLLGFKRHDVANNGNMANINNVPSFKYKANLIGNTKANGTKKE